MAEPTEAALPTTPAPSRRRRARRGQGERLREEILARLEEQPKAIAALTAGLTRARLHSPPSRGEWSVNAVLAHLRS